MNGERTKFLDFSKKSEQINVSVYCVLPLIFEYFNFQL